MSAMNGQVQIVRQSARTLGVELPKALTQQVQAADKLIAAAENISGAGELTGAVLAALAKGDDVRDDPEIIRLAVGAVIEQSGVSQAARSRADADIEDALREHSDAILGSWALALEPHAEALLAAATELPTQDLDATQAIVAAGAPAMALWSAAQAARKPWAAAIQGFVAVASINHLSVQKRSPLILCDDLDVIAAAENIAAREGTPLDAWMIARAGAAPSLATIGGFGERAASHEARRQAAELAFEKQQRASV